MSTIDRRIADLERDGAFAQQSMLVVLHGTEPDVEQAAAIEAAARAGRQFLRVRFVEPDRAGEKQ